MGLKVKKRENGCAAASDLSKKCLKNRKGGVLRHEIEVMIFLSDYTQEEYIMNEAKISLDKYVNF